MPLIDHIVRCEYRGVAFPCAEVKDSRDNTSKAHTAWRVPGADIEHTGRGPLKITMRALFLNGMTGAWPADMFPGQHDLLESAFLEHPNGTLTHPYYGPVEVHFDSFERVFTPDSQEGVTVELSFTENNASAFYPAAIVQQEPGAQLAASAAAADEAVAEITDGLFALSPVVETQLDYLEAEDRDAGQAQGALAFLRTATQLQLDSLLLTGPEAHDARALLRAVLAASFEYAERYLTPKPQSRTYVVPARMSLARLASLIYGDPTKSALLRRANTLPDELFVPAGFVVTVPDAV